MGTNVSLKSDQNHLWGHVNRKILKRMTTVLSVVAMTVATPPPSRAQLEVKANNLAEIKFSGRVNLQYNTTSVGDNRSSEFLLRRVRLTAEFKLSRQAKDIGFQLMPSYWLPLFNPNQESASSIWALAAVSFR